MYLKRREKCFTILQAVKMKNINFLSHWKQKKQEMYNKILEIYYDNRLNKNIKREIEEKVLNVKNIRQVKKEELRELLKSQV